MQITRTEAYGLKGVLSLVRQPPGKGVLVNEVSRNQKIPETFLAKIFQRLSKAGLLKSIRGSGREFHPAKPANQITMSEVMEALEGPIAINRCLTGRGVCESQEDCALHEVWERAQQNLVEVLDKTTLEDPARGKKSVTSDQSTMKEGGRQRAEER
jgi:Rrf2 family protein